MAWSGGTRSTYNGLFPPGAADAEAQARRAVADLEKMANTVPLDAPWEAPRAVEWETQTLDSWLATSLSLPRACDR
jgi:monoamine oxidase